ncbi:sulfatase-like hydrolase/transferase [Caniella muris]|uniref:sulfatase-like hydrolase/transferase n=1 Tax=Caniella muris TaxID=2941502 RepID=UPI0020402689|nr:sulfatase-like hydrolase/transferase [Caniella muris]
MRPKTRRTLARLALDGVWALACVTLALAPTPALAYVDPSVVTYTIQALAGVAVALSAVVGVVWRRVRRRVFALLKIDENRDKVRDPEVHEIDPSAPGAAALLAEADAAATADEALVGPNRPQNVRWLPRLLLALVAWGCLVYTLGVVTPLEIVATSLDSFTFGVGPLFGPLVGFAVALAAGGALLLSLVRGRGFTVAVSVVAALSVACFVQSAFLNTGLPVADGKAVAWEDYTKITLVSSLVWVALVAGAAALALLKGRSAKTAACVLSVVLVAVQSVGLVTTWNEQQQVLDAAESQSTVWDGKPLVTTEGMYELSGKDNVVMIVLDTLDNSFIDKHTLVRYPDALDGFTGFTRYANTSGVMIPTRYAMSSLVTGQNLDDGDEVWDNAKIAEWYSEENLVDAMRGAGYGVNVYATDMPQGTASLVGRVGNVHRVDLEAPFWPTVTELWKCSLYREAPWALKPPFWFYSGDVVGSLVGEGDAGDKTPFKLDDAAMLDTLRTTGLSVGDTVEGEKGTYRLIHMSGAHSPITLSVDGERVEEGTTDLVDQIRGSLKIVQAYLDELKRLGVYDDTTVIITADHGEWYLADEIFEPSSPFLMIKPAQSAEADAEPLKVSHAPVSQRDLPATLLKIMGDEGYGEWGRAIDEIGEDEQRTRLYNATSVIGDRHVYTAIKEWAITGDVNDWSAWEKTGREWPIDQ